MLDKHSLLQYLPTIQQMIIVESYKKNNHGMNKLETQLEITSHHYKALKYGVANGDSSWWEHALKIYFVGASLSGLLIEATPPQAIKHCQ